MKRLLTSCGLIIISLSLNACGFSLRGNELANSRFSELQLNLSQPNSEFSRMLRRSLDVAEISTELVSSLEDVDLTSPIAVLAIGDEQISNRPVTVNARARAAQYEMRLSVTIALGQANELLIEPETLFVDRTYFEDIENLAGNREEVEIIAAEMRRELVNQLMRRLESADS
jgi:LPS-assembly lipoprotein